jgi:gentisate 1,2-dioxygenase
MERFDLEQQQALDTNNGYQKVESEFKPVLV